MIVARAVHYNVFLNFSRYLCLSQLFDTEEQKGDLGAVSWWSEKIRVSWI